MDVTQAFEIVLDVLEHVQADHRIHTRREIRETGALLQVAVADTQVRAVLEARRQPRQMFRIDIGGYIARSPRN